MADYLKAVAGVYYYWRKVPLDLVNSFQQSHLKVSLRTRNKRDADEQTVYLSLWCNRIFAIMRSQAFEAEEINRMLANAPFNMSLRNAANSSGDTAQNLPTVQALYEIYETEHLRAGRWREKTRTDQRQMVRIFVELLGGDILINSVNRQTLLQIREQICRLPPNLTKDKRFRGMPLAAILSLSDYKAMSHTRAYRIVSHLGAFLKWSFNHGYLNTDVSSGLYMPKKRESRQNEERDIYSDDDLKRLFATEVFTGNEAIDRPECFFLPLLYKSVLKNSLYDLVLNS